MTCLPDISLPVGWELGRFSATVETLASRYNLVLKETAMNAKGAAILLDPHPCCHIVYPYTDESLVGQAVALFASAGLRDGEGVVLIMSCNHCAPIKIR